MTNKPSAQPERSFRAVKKCAEVWSLLCDSERVTCDFEAEQVLKMWAREHERAGIERAAQKAHEWTLHSCEPGKGHEDNPCCHVRTGAGIEAAIRALATEEER